MKITNYLLLFFVLLLSCGVFLPAGMVHAGDNITVYFNEPYGSDEFSSTTTPPSNITNWTLYYNGTFPSTYNADAWEIALNNLPSSVAGYDDIWIKLVYPGTEWGGIGSNWQTLAADVATSILTGSGNGNFSFNLDGTLSLTGCGNTANDIMVQAYWALGTKTATPTNGACNTNEECLTSAPTGYICTQGAYAQTDASQITISSKNGSWYWACPGTHGGTTAYCSASSSILACGSAAGIATSTSPLTHLCSSGKATSPYTDGTSAWSWTCTDSCSYNTCTAPLNGLCGNADGSITTATPLNVDLCAMGTPNPSSVTLNTSNQTWNWTCVGSTGGSTDTCTAYLKGVCNKPPAGTNYTTKASIPSTLCASGTASAITLAPGGTSSGGPWTWTCSGSSAIAGSTATCATRPPLNGVCGPAATTYYK